MTDDGGPKRLGPPVEARNITDNKRVESHNVEIYKDYQFDLALNQISYQRI